MSNEPFEFEVGDRVAFPCTVTAVSCLGIKLHTACGLSITTSPLAIEFVSRPKKKIKRTINVWVNVYSSSEYVHLSRDDADDAAVAHGRIDERISCEHFTREIEVEE